MYAIVQGRWIRDSDQSGENIVWSGDRKREAEGQLKAQLHSHFDMLIKHDFFGCNEYYVDPDRYSIVLADDDSVYYVVYYKLVEM